MSLSQLEQFSKCATLAIRGLRQSPPLGLNRRRFRRRQSCSWIRDLYAVFMDLRLSHTEILKHGASARGYVQGAADLAAVAVQQKSEELTAAVLADVRILHRTLVQANCSVDR